LELIVLDAGSSDGSDAILAKYRPFLSFLRIAPDRGQSHALNQGFSLASGDLFAWLNSDDFYLPDTLRLVASCFRRHAPSLIYGDLGELDQGSGSLVFQPARLVHPAFRKHGGLLYQPSTFWAAHSHLPLNEDLHCSMDFDLWLRMLPGARLRYLPQVLSIARIHTEAKTHSPKHRQAWASDAELNGRNYPGLFRSTPAADFLCRHLQRLVARWRRRRQAHFTRTARTLLPELHA
jgi:glycosyltransferase involved in cell wall biosynthesis